MTNPTDANGRQRTPTDAPLVVNDSCKHYWQPKYEPKLVPSMAICRCIKCGKEDWTAFEQAEEWRKNGLDGKQVQETGRPNNGH